MSRTARRALTGLVLGGFHSILLSGCAGGASPISPATTAIPSSLAEVPRPVTQTRTIDNTAAIKKQEFRFVECLLPDGSMTQISVAAFGMPDAVHHCLKDLDGRSDGVIKAPPPPLP